MSYENHRQDLSKIQKLQQRRLGPFIVTKRITNTTYQIQDDKDPTILKTVHRNHLFEYYPNEESLPPMIEEYVPSDTHRDDLYERFMERWVQQLIDPKETATPDSNLFPIMPLSSAPSSPDKKSVIQVMIRVLTHLQLFLLQYLHSQSIIHLEHP